MKIHNENNNSTLHDRCLRHSALAGAVAFALTSSSAFAAMEFHPRGEVSVGWTDNLTLVADDDPNKESAWVLQANPGFTWQEHAQRLRAMVDYTMQNLFFPGNTDRNTTYHEGSAAAEAELAKQFFYLDGSATYSQQIIDPKLPATNSNFFAVNNQADALTAQLTPAIRHDFDLFHLDASYTRGIVDYKVHEGPGDLQDADTETRRGELSSLADSGGRVSWKLRYESQIVKYDLSPRFRYDQANAELGILLVNAFRVIGRAGKETDPTLDFSAGGLDRSWWEGGFTWAPGERTNIEAFYGRRFYGHSYNASFRHSARRLSFDAHYSETPTTQAQQLANQQVGFDPHQLGSFVPGTYFFSRLTSDVFVRKAADANLHITGQRTIIDLGVTGERREYLQPATGREEARSASVNFTRILSKRSRFYIGGNAANNELRDGTEYNDVYLRTGASRGLTEHVNIAVNAFRLRRTGSGAGVYIANGASISLTGEF